MTVLKWAMEVKTTPAVCLKRSQRGSSIGDILLTTQRISLTRCRPQTTSSTRLQTNHCTNSYPRWMAEQPASIEHCHRINKLQRKKLKDWLLKQKLTRLDPRGRLMNRLIRSVKLKSAWKKTRRIKGRQVVFSLQLKSST